MTATLPRSGARAQLHQMFVFFSNRLGCAGSIAVSVVLSALLYVAFRGCSTGAPTW